MKKYSLKSLMLALVLVLFTPFMFAGCELVGNKGKIETSDQLVDLIKNGFESDVKYSLGNDIYVGGDSVINNDSQTGYDDLSEMPYVYRNIVFDGNNHTITNLTIGENLVNNGYRFVSIFGNVSSLTVKNVTFEMFDAEGENYIAGLASYAKDATLTFENVTFKSSKIDAAFENVGSLVAYANNCTFSIINCKIDDTEINGSTYVGGAFGRIENSSIDTTMVSNISIDNSTVTGGGQIGGIIGSLEQNKRGGTIKYKNLKNNNTEVVGTDGAIGGVVGHTLCYDEGKITVDKCENNSTTAKVSSTYGSNVGGVLGGATFKYYTLVPITGLEYEMTDCKNSAIVEGKSNVGGVAGVIGPTINTALIKDCSNTGDVKATGICAGGIMGSDVPVTSGGTVTFKNCINNGGVAAKEFAGGIVSRQCEDGTLIKFLGELSFDNCQNLTDNAGADKIVAQQYAGGICGRNGTKFLDCKNNMNIYLDAVTLASGLDKVEYAGGIAGQSYDGSFTNCENTGDISVLRKNKNSYVRYLGGIVGHASEIMFTNCKSECSIYGTDCLGGIAGYISPGDTVIMKDLKVDCDLYSFGDYGDGEHASEYECDNLADITSLVDGKTGIVFGFAEKLTSLNAENYKNIDAKGDIYIAGNVNLVGGLIACTKTTDETVLNTLQNGSANNVVVNYNIIFCSNVSQVCKDNICYGQKAFVKALDACPFNNPTQISYDNAYTEQFAE